MPIKTNANDNRIPIKKIGVMFKLVKLKPCSVAMIFQIDKMHVRKKDVMCKNIARDIASLGEIRARIMSDKSINSLNFSIDVVNDKAYISGVATDELELNLVKNHASSARFVTEVYNYIILKKDTRWAAIWI